MPGQSFMNCLSTLLFHKRVFMMLVWEDFITHVYTHPESFQLYTVEVLN